MPTIHIFRRPDGTLFPRALTLAQSEKCRIVGTRYDVPGEGEVTRDVAKELELAGRTPGEFRRELARYPIKSYSLGVTKQRAGELRERLRQKLGHTCVDERGAVVFESESHRRKVARALGHVSTDSFYD